MLGRDSGVVALPWSSPRSLHHAAIARKIQLPRLSRFPEPPPSLVFEVQRFDRTRNARCQHSFGGGPRHVSSAAANLNRFGSQREGFRYFSLPQNVLSRTIRQTSNQFKPRLMRDLRKFPINEIVRQLRALGSQFLPFRLRSLSIPCLQYLQSINQYSLFDNGEE